MLITTVRLGQVQPHPHNIRRDVGDVSELAESFKSSGMLQPLVVAPTPGARPKTKNAPMYTLIAGHRRLAAAKACEWQEVDVIVRDDLDTEAKQIETMAIENLQRTNLSPIEEARGYQQLLDLGYTPARIAKQTGRNAKTVKLRLGLNKLSDKASEKVHAGQITLEQAEVLASFAKNPKAYAELEKSIGTSNFAFKVQQVKEKQARDAKRSKLADDLDKAGVTRIKQPAGFPWTSTEKPLHDLRIEPADHVACPGHAAFVSDDQWSPVAVKYVCTDPVANGHVEAPGGDVDTAGIAAASRAEYAQNEAERERQAARRADLQTAEATRHEFVKQLLAKSKLPTGALVPVLRAAVRAYFDEIVEYAEPDVLLDVLGVDPSLEQDERFESLERELSYAVDVPALSRLLFGAVFALNDPGVHNFVERPRREVMAMLLAVGYELADVEQSELDRTAPPTPEPDVETVVPSDEFADAI
jgi:ParB family chromosome partitioning protein